MTDVVETITSDQPVTLTHPRSEWMLEVLDETQERVMWIGWDGTVHWRDQVTAASEAGELFGRFLTEYLLTMGVLEIDTTRTELVKAALALADDTPSAGRGARWVDLLDAAGAYRERHRD